jgi:hypothetical protein
MDFVHDQLFDDRPFRMLTVVDQFRRVTIEHTFGRWLRDSAAELVSLIAVAECVCDEYSASTWLRRRAGSRKAEQILD